MTDRRVPKTGKQAGSIMGTLQRSVPARAWRRLLWYYRGRFRQWNFVFRADGPFLEDARDDCLMVRYDSAESVPQEVIDQIQSDGGERRWQTDAMELAMYSTLWVAIVGDRVATAVFTREGRYFKRWFLPLRPTDVVVFRLRTHSDFRGRGLAVSLMRYAMAQTIPGGSSGFVDCRTYNKPSIRCIEKAGFIRVAKMKTISREWVLGLE